MKTDPSFESLQTSEKLIKNRRKTNGNEDTVTGTDGIKPIKNQRVKKTQGISNPVLQPRLLTIEEAGRFLGRSLWSMRELIWRGSIPIVREGKRIFIDIQDLESYIIKHKTTYL